MHIINKQNNSTNKYVVYENLRKWLFFGIEVADRCKLCLIISFTAEIRHFTRCPSTNLVLLSELHPIKVVETNNGK